MSQKHALIIGNSEYEDQSLARLVTPDADVDALAEVLRDPEIGGFDEVARLVNQPASNIRRAIAAFFAGRGRDDLLLLYFSGHGIRDDRGQLFLAAKDTEHHLLRGTGIPAAFITDEMDNSRSRRQVLILDCCHSGAFSRGMKGVPGASVGTAAAFEGTGSGRVVLTATDSTQYAWEGDRVIGQAENSVFTHYLTQGLCSGEADTDADGRVTLDELYDYVYERVVHETPMQTPGKWSYGQQGEIVIARNPHPVVKPAELPADLQQTIDDPRPWVREGAVRELDRLLRGGHPGLALAAQEALKRLVNDDSRRVANLATESLASYAEAQPTSGKTRHELGEPARRIEREAQEPEVGAQAEEEHGAPEKGSLKPAAQERPVLEWPERADAAGGLKAVETAEAEAEGPVATINRAVTNWEMIWPPILMTTLGWAIVFAIFFAIAFFNDSPIYGAFAGAILGWITALALRRIAPSIHRTQTLILIIGWAITAAINWGDQPPIGLVTDSNLVAAILVGFIAGLTTWLALRRTERSIHWKQLLVIAVGWAIAGFIGGAILIAIVGDINNIGSALELAIAGAILGGVVGAIGSVVMFWQLDWRVH